jgi:type II secretory ATPase GspE/PulE/Tfp pilus assembly ATPase PilB-like protein
MRIIMFLILSSFLLSQPTNDSLEIPVTTTSEIPEEVKPVVEEIVSNSEQVRIATSEINKEMKKQLDLMKEIKLKLQKSPKKVQEIIKASKPVIERKDSVQSSAIKPDSTDIYIDGQLVKWEFKQKTVFGIVFHSGYYPYIMDKNTKRRVYLK